MDNLTHSLVGLAAAKTGLERLSPAATTVCMIVANAPDADILATISGRWAYLEHHRGITHSIVGTIALAVLIPALFWLGDRLIARIAGRKPTIRLGGLIFASLIATATHPLLDWTNNYGVRPLLPWSGTWYYGDIVFIIDPWIWLFIGGACFLMTAKNRWQIGTWSLLGTVLTLAVVLVPMLRPGSVFPLTARIFWIVGIVALIVAHRMRLADRWKTAIPIAAFALLVVYWGGLSVVHQKALAKSEAMAKTLAAGHGETLTRIVAMPVLANPVRWQCVFETESATYRFDLSLVKDNIPANSARYEKLVGQEAERYVIATRDPRAEVFLGFARFPVARVNGDCISETLVEFADLRYTEPGRGRRGTFSLDVPIECPQAIGASDIK